MGRGDRRREDQAVMRGARAPAPPREAAPSPAGGAFGELRLEEVTRAFGGAVALAGLTLTVKRGEFVTLLGPSGCGKSTALNCIAGLLPVTQGSIWLDDRRIDVLRPEERGFGMVFQNYALFPHMTVRKNIGFGPRPARRARRKAAGPALRRPAAARRHRPGDRRAAAARAHGRAAVESRR